MSENQSHYFYVLHQIEIALDLDHDELIQASKQRLDVWAEKWFAQRGRITGDKRDTSEKFKQSLFDWKETERELEES